MGKHFGELVTNARGLLTFSISPYEQRAFAGFFSKGFKNFARRTMESTPYVAPGVVMTVLLYQWANHSFHQRMLKNPKDYANDV
eukprot:m.17484 g.17484  ORF g.17484 m.17484 type:complete len:84 (+) comp7146_c0_seq1:189-440(+)